MRFECDSCQAKYKISDDKVRGRVLRFPCRRCNHKILIDGRQVNAEVTVPAGAAYGFEEVTRRSGAASFYRHEAPTARASRASSVPARRRPPSVPPRRSAAASRRLTPVPPKPVRLKDGQHPGLAPPVPAPAGTKAAAPRARELPQWHVSINDVPIGPIRLEEMGHKVDSGAVSEYSLVWREGFEEWRPLATVPELMALLHQRRTSGLPPRTPFSSMPPLRDSAMPSARPRVSSRAPSDDLLSLSDSLQPESGLIQPHDRSKPPAPIGPEESRGSSPSIGSFSGLALDSDDLISVPPVPPEEVAASAEPRRGPSLGALALIVAIAVFSGVAAYLVFERYGESLMNKWLGASSSSLRSALAASSKHRVETDTLAEANAPDEASTLAKTSITAEASRAGEADTTAEASRAGETGTPAEASRAGEADTPAEASAAAEASTAAEGSAPGEANALSGAQRSKAAAPAPQQAALLVPPPDPTDDGPKIAPASAPRTDARRKARSEPAVVPAEREGSLSDDEEKILREFGSSSTAGPARIAVKPAAGAKNDEPPLDGAGVRATVSANKPRLQRCYERAIRGQQSPPSVRLDVTVMVASSGRVKEVNAEGDAPGGLAECVAASVRRWRFPASSDGGPAKFPLVFSAN